MSRVRVLLGSAALAAVVVLALLLAGSQPTVVRTFTLDVPDQYAVAILRRGARVCEGPVESRQPVGGVAIWGSPLKQRARPTVQVLEAPLLRPLATGRLVLTPSAAEYRAPLDRPVPASRQLEVCLVQRAGAFSLAGFPVINPGVSMSGRVPGPQPTPLAGRVFSLALLSPPSRSLLAWLSLAFGRASLWHPAWVGSWTFWLLTIGLLLAFVLGALAVGLGAAADG